ncbi:MAG: L,D-transpeptidase family protein [Candidatus Brocadiae bacterium]|nr:L,D-transpeptidase family protein [Candidatus Brocadiia bacterium]
MRKLLVLLLVAAVVGMVMSRGRRADKAPGGADGGVAVALTGADPSGETVSLSVEDATGDAQAPAGPDGARQETATEPDASGSTAPSLLSASTTGSKTATVRGEPDPVQAALHGRRLAAAVARAGSLVEAGKWLEARAILSSLYLESRGEWAAQLRELLDQINKELVFNPRCLIGAQVHVVQPGENLTKIGKKYGVNGQMIARLNGMADDRLRTRQKLKVLTGRTSAVLYKGEFRLALLLDGVYVKEYPVGIGKDDLTPTGELTVDTKLVHPDWYPPGGIIKYGEEGYQLGERWIGFADEPGAARLGIHGTDDEGTIGTKCSKGCIRLRNEDVIELYDFMQTGSRVRIWE